MWISEILHNWERMLKTGQTAVEDDYHDIGLLGVQNHMSK